MLSFMWYANLFDMQIIDIILHFAASDMKIWHIDHQIKRLLPQGLIQYSLSELIYGHS